MEKNVKKKKICSLIFKMIQADIWSVHIQTMQLIIFD